MTKLTEAHIRHAMRLKDDVTVMLGKLDGFGTPGIAIVGPALYTYRQHGNFGANVVMSLQFVNAPTTPFRYPATVSFSLTSSADEAKVKRMQVAVSEFVTTLQAEGDHDGAAKVGALLALPMEDLISVHDALAVGMTRDAFIKSLTETVTQTTVFHVYQMRMSESGGSVALYACGPARPGSKETQWRIHKNHAHQYDADGVEALRAAYPALKLRTEAVR